MLHGINYYRELILYKINCIALSNINAQRQKTFSGFIYLNISVKTYPAKKTAEPHVTK